MASVNFERETCTRCGGTGKYSFNLKDGDMCYGCKGTGMKLTKRGAAAAAYAREISEVTIEAAINGGFEFTVNIFGKNIRVATTEFVPAEESGFASLNPVTGEYERFAVYSCFDKNGKGLITGPANTPVRRVITADMVEQVEAYQASLTKAGKVSKRKMGAA